MRASSVSVMLCAAAALFGCGSGADDAAGRTTPMPDAIAGVYDGTFPCSNCPAIAVTLWLRPDGRFFLRQAYPGAGDEPETRSYGLGRWTWDERAALLVLAGAGPERRFAPRNQHQIELRTLSAVEHLLTRAPAAPAFSDRVRLDGESAIVDGEGRFKECLTGLELPVAKEAGFDDLRRQHRRLNPRGKFALTAVDARLTEVASGDSTVEVLVVERVIDIKPGAGC